jgi:hypothetical protein
MGFVLPALSMISFARSMRGPPEGCGAAYVNLIQATGERTPANPYHWAGIAGCKGEDVDAWKAAAGKIFKLYRQAWNKLMALDNAGKNWAATKGLTPSANAYEAAHGALEGGHVWQIFGVGGCSKAIAEAIDNMQEGACLLDQLNQAIIAQGGAPGPVPDMPPPPKPPPGPMHWLKWGGVAAAGVLLLVLLWKMK